MATVSLQIEGQNVDLSPADLKDLGSASEDLKLIYSALKSLDSQLSSIQDGTLGSVTLDSGNPSWTLGGSPATFSLKATATATMTLQSKGPLFTYYADFGNTDAVNVPIESHQVYVVTEFQFQISGQLSASAPIGTIGVTTDDSGSASYIVRHYKQFSPDTKCRDAIQHALTNFTLPLHAKTIPNLSDGDCLYYEFDGSVSLGFGVTYGISTSVGGYSMSEISSTFQKIGKVANISASQAFTAGADAGLSLKFDWSRTFQCFVERSKPQGSLGSAKLHLMKGKTSQRSLELSLNGGITNISAPQLTVDSQVLTQSALQAITGQTGSLSASPLQTPLDAVQQEIQKYIDDANQWLSGLTQKVQADGQISLSLLFQNSAQLTSAFTWNFDAVSASFETGWSDAIKGDFVAALASGSATLEPESGFESEHSRNTKLTFTFFGLGQFSSLDSYFTNSTLTYGKNGSFYLETKTGKLSSSSNKANSTSTSIYLDGTGQNLTGGNSVTNVDIKLHGVLTTTGSSDQVSRLGNLLQALGVALQGNISQPAVTLGSALKTLARQTESPGAVVVHVIYQMSALNRLRSDLYVNGNQAQPPHLLDAVNWDAYAFASGPVPTDPASFLSTWLPSSNFYKSYDSWALFNCIVNGFTDPDGNPTPMKKTDRHYLGVVQPAALRGCFGSNLSDTTCTNLGYYFSAGQQYMNLCDDLHTVVGQITASASVDWTRLTAKLEQIAGDDVDAWFGPSILLALVRSTQASQAVMQQGALNPSAASGAIVISIA